MNTASASPKGRTRRNPGRLERMVSVIIQHRYITDRRQSESPVTHPDTFSPRRAWRVPSCQSGVATADTTKTEAGTNKHLSRRFSVPVGGVWLRADKSTNEFICQSRR